MQPPQQPVDETPADRHEANPGYAVGQLARALAASENHEDPTVRARSRRKVEAWAQVFQGMLSGALRVGSRVPVTGSPSWATLEVVQGGFATGNLLAGGELQPHEKDLLDTLPAVTPGQERAALNAYYLSEKGLAELVRFLETGFYGVQLPEEGALLVVAWLVQHDQTDQARTLLDEIAPFLSRLRFYPIPTARPAPMSASVHLQDVGATVDSLEAIRPAERFLVMKESIEVWLPLYDRVVSLFLETVEGQAPCLRLAADGIPLRDEVGKFAIEGGWPCQHYPESWQDRALVALSDYRRHRAEHPRCSSVDSSKKGFATLRRYLEQCLVDPKKLTGRDVGMIRSILAGIVVRLGLPDSAGWKEYRDSQRRQVTGPTLKDLSRVLIDRLSRFPHEEGLTSLDEVLAPVRTEEADRFAVPADKAMPEQLARRVQRCLDAPVEVLVEHRVIPSAEVLARVIPQMTSQVRAAGIADRPLRRVYGAIYAAFRRRRSLLLLNLESQVKLEELPWIRAIHPHRADDGDTRRQARQVLEQIVALAVTAFPQQILPNKLLQEIRALADGAGLHLPIVDEVAADIFMGTFSEKFLRAAQEAGELLRGSLYERYYGLPYDRVGQMKDVKASRFGTPTSSAFARLCFELAGEADSRTGRKVAQNGKIIEQEQILTTHNLAVLFDALGLREVLRSQLEELAFRCFGWVCQRQQQKIDSWKARLQMVKNAAYAWRQMVFFLSMIPAENVELFLSKADGRVRGQKPDFQTRFLPALRGLTNAARGLPVEASATSELPGEARRFLGWTIEHHWLLG